MVRVTKTLNPIPFEHLEPHRFEDLVRQLIYDFKSWKNLEATGRSGGDDGFDARGYELLDKEGALNEGDDEETIQKQDTRLWLIQCKREKSITPAKIVEYISEVLSKLSEKPYGVIFIAPCDLSKTTRDKFVEEIRKHGVQEYHLWGKGELEDALFQPKNDHLLFAYFGFSLQIRKRNQKTELRSLFALKRKLINTFGDVRGQRYHHDVLIRDINDKHYPYSEKIPKFKEHPKWKAYQFSGYWHEGIVIRVRKYYAHLDRKTGHYDFTEKVDLARPHDDCWNNEKEKGNPNWEVYSYWSKLPKENKVYFEIERLIPFDRIAGLDPDGDPYTPYPHLYVEGLTQRNGFFNPGEYINFVSEDYYPTERISKTHKRVKFFPKTFPDPNETTPEVKPETPSNKKIENTSSEFEDLKKLDK